MAEEHKRRVYISSTLRDLRKERQTVVQLVADLGLKPVIYEEFVADVQEDAYQRMIDEIRQSDLFIGIYSQYYGHIPEQNAANSEHVDGQRSFIHMEYDWALERGIPMLLFFRSPHDEDGKPIEDQRESDPSRREKLEAFKAEVSQAKSVLYFSSLAQLWKRAGTDLVRFIICKLSGQKQELIFISHSSKDDSFVRRLTYNLECAGAKSWVDHKNIPPGADWDTWLELAIEASDYMILVITPNSLQSFVTKAEWSYFSELDSQPIPLLLKDVPKIPFRLRLLQYVDFRTDPVKGFEQLLEALGLPSSKVTWTP